MKRFLVGLILVLVAVPILGTTVFADRGPSIPGPWTMTMTSVRNH
jgi:hypothetical protein